MTAAPPEYQPYIRIETRYGVKTMHRVIASPENIKGYCKHHHGYLSKKESKAHKCKQKKCWHFREVELEEAISKAETINLSD